MARLPFEEACDQYPHRFTMEHVPRWARDPIKTDAGTVYYAPQYRTDREWYENTIFPGDTHQRTFTAPPASERYCESRGQTWPLGHFLNQPYRRTVHA